MSHRSLRAHEVTFAYLDGPTVLDAASLDIRPGRRLALLGANGSGKSTLLSCLAGSLAPDAGAILLDDQPVRFNRKALRRHREEVQLVLQDPDDQLFSADVAQDVSFGPMNLGLSQPRAQERTSEALNLLGIEHLCRKPTHQLSFGEKKRVAVAGAVAMRPCILLLDEPTAGLDPFGVDEMLAALHRLEQQSTTVVVSTHDLAFALEWAHDVAIMEQGSVLTGAPTTLLRDRELLSRARLKVPWALALAASLEADDLVHPDSAPRNPQEIHHDLRAWRAAR